MFSRSSKEFEGVRKNCSTTRAPAVSHNTHSFFHIQVPLVLASQAIVLSTSSAVNKGRKEKAMRTLFRREAAVLKTLAQLRRHEGSEKGHTSPGFLCYTI